MYCPECDCSESVTVGDDKWCAECGHDLPLSNDEIIAAAISRFPKTFGLRAFPGDTFSISAACSYVGSWQDPSTLMLYTEIQCKDGKWRAFAKGSEAELRREVVSL